MTTLHVLYELHDEQEEGDVGEEWQYRWIQALVERFAIKVVAAIVDLRFPGLNCQTGQEQNRETFVIPTE